MDQKALLTVSILALCVGPIIEVNAQTTIDMEYCDQLGLNCGTSNAKKYCCIESNGPYPKNACCNPYIELAIGICVGVPLVAAIVIGVIVLYCCCSRYQNRKMDRLMIAYRLQLQEEGAQDGTEEISPAAPPPYAPSQDPNSRLPEYTATDPFAQSKSGDAEGNADTPGGTEPDERTLQVGEQVGITSESQRDNIPLLSDN